MKKKRGFDLKREYGLAWDFLKESKKFIAIVVAVFLVFLLVGFFVPAPEILEKIIMDFLLELLEATEGMNSAELIRYILFNNFKTSFFGVVFGLALGIFPFLASLSNGYILGFVARLSVNEKGFWILWRLVPHGIFELPAIFISFGLGIKLGTFVFKKDRAKHFYSYLANALRVFILIVVPLLIIAAIIEGLLIGLSI